MKKGQRPSKHVRRVRTRNGVKRVVVNPRIRSKKKGIISKKDRRLFAVMSSPAYDDKEFGGQLDFSKDSKLERFTVHPGTKTQIMDLPDWEATYHTHPTSSRYVILPSADDLIALVKGKPNQAQVIFRKGHALVIVKTKKTKYLSKLSEDKLRTKFNRMIIPARTEKEYVNQNIQELQKLGFHVFLSKGGTLTIPIKPKD